MSNQKQKPSIFGDEFPPKPKGPPPSKGWEPSPELLTWLGAGLPVAGLVAVIRWRMRRMRRMSPEVKDQLDSALFHFTPNDPFTVRHLLTSALIFGRTGSGKTSSSGRQILLHILKLVTSGGVICCAKPAEDIALIKELFRLAGRERDLMLFEPGGPLRFNMLDHLLKTGADTREIAQFLMVVGETLNTSDTKGGENSDFFEKQNFRCFYHTINVCKHAFGMLDSWDMQGFVNGAATSEEQAANAKWQDGDHFRTIERAEENVREGSTEQHDLDMAMQYWVREWPCMSDRMRSSILAGVMHPLFVLNSGQVRQLVSSSTNFDLSDTLRGKFLVIDMAPAKYGDSGRFVNAGFKDLAQRMVLRRTPTPDTPPHVIWCDEYQNITTSRDAYYLSSCRSRRGCMVALTQSMHGLFAAMKGQSGEHLAKLLMSNFGTRIFHALGSAQDAKEAAELIGRERQIFFSGGSGQPVDAWDGMFGSGGATGGFSEQLDYIINPRHFMNGMRCGGPLNNYVCDSIVIRSGEVFAHTGENFMPVMWGQT